MSDCERDLVDELDAFDDRLATTIRAMYLWQKLVEVRDQIRELPLPPRGDARRTRARLVGRITQAANSLRSPATAITRPERRSARST